MFHHHHLHHHDLCVHMILYAFLFLFVFLVVFLVVFLTCVLSFNYSFHPAVSCCCPPPLSLSSCHRHSLSSPLLHCFSSFFIFLFLLYLLFASIPLPNNFTKLSTHRLSFHLFPHSFNLWHFRLFPNLCTLFLLPISFAVLSQSSNINLFHHLL